MLAYPKASRLLKVYKLLRWEMLQEWSRFNFWDADRNRWVRRPKESWGVAARGGGLWRMRRKREKAPSSNTQARLAEVPDRSCAIKCDLVVRDGAQQDHDHARFVKGAVQLVICPLACHDSSRLQSQGPIDEQVVPAACAQKRRDSSAKAAAVNESLYRCCSVKKKELAGTTTNPSISSTASEVEEYHFVHGAGQG